ncbi:hypothetical protein QYE76_031951 [Lolium multiflorum]|uniref:Transposase (putative) gypsy type domain-containing protein n=1 Tax=Lolium multiflorum TaxID=4521 RepID=A0AAD8QW97_LOLMU|nr:hypothetical protein QYE76_031951 [Lolium multiflorum]
MATEDLEWERSKISSQDMNLLKKLGFAKKKDALRFPHEESYPSPPMEYRVSFVDHLIRGLSPPIHEFLRGLLFVYGLQLHQLTPNSILHVSIFITLCECFLGVPPNWALWKRIFCLRRNGSHGVAYNIGGVVICVRSDVDYFDVKFPDSVQGWRKKWLYVHEESSDSVEYNIAPFDGKTKILRRRSWDAEATEEEKLATKALMTRIRELQSTRGKELSGIQITSYFLRIRKSNFRENPRNSCKALFYQNIDGARRAREVEARGPTPHGGAGGARAAMWCGPLGRPPAFGLLIGFDLKTHGEKSKSPETLRRAATSRNSVSGAEVSVLALRRDGELEEIITAITANASPSTSNVSPIHV